MEDFWYPIVVVLVSVGISGLVSWALCAYLYREENKRLRDVVEWALTKGCEIAQNKGWDAYEKELRRMAGEGK
jgi:hypothetical protein